MFAGLDIGSTNAKFSIYSINGRLLAEASERYPVASDEAGLTADAIWDAAQHVMGMAYGKLPDGGHIIAMAVSAFGESLVPVDAEGKVVSNRFVCSPVPGNQELYRIMEQIPEEKIREITGVLPHRRFPLVKMLWFSQHIKSDEQPFRYMMMEDFIIYRLTGRFAVSESSAARSMAYDYKKHCWSRELLELIGVGTGQLSEILPSGGFVGVILPEVCKRLGVRGGVKVYSGGHDQMCNAVGAGLCEYGKMVNCSGTVECISGLFRLEQAEQVMGSIPLQLATYPQHPDSCFSFWAPVAGCSSLDWCLRLTAGCGPMNDREMVQRHIAMQALCSDSPSSLLAAPYLTGRNYPDFSGEARAFVYGLGLQTKPQELYQSIMEGIVFELKLCMERFGVLAEGKQEIVAVGGGAASDYWLQMKADIMGMTVVRPEHRQSGTMGAMLLAAVGEGYYHDLTEAAGVCVKANGVFYPEQQRGRLYEEKFYRYCKFRNNLFPQIGVL